MSVHCLESAVTNNQIFRVQGCHHCAACRLAKHESRRVFSLFQSKYVSLPHGIRMLQAAPPAGIPDSAANDNGQGLSTAPSLSASLPPLPPNHTRNLSASAQSALTSMWQSAASPTPSVTDRSTDLMSSYHAGGFSAGSTGTGRPMLTTADRFPSNHSRSRNRSMGDGSVVSMPRPTSAQGRYDLASLPCLARWS